MDKFIKKELRIPAPGGDLVGELYLPIEQKEKYPMVIVCHGMYYTYMETRKSCMTLAEHGYASYCFDFHGCSYTNASGGDLFHCSILTEADEVEAVFDYFKKQNYIDDSKLFLLGQSLGTIPVSLVAAKFLEAVTGIILMYPAYHSFDVIRNMFPELEDIPDVFENWIGIQGLDFGRKFFEDIWKCDFFNIVDKYKKPVLVIHGDKDNTAPLVYAEKARDTFEKSKLVILKDRDHNFQLDESNISIVTEFLSEY